LSARPPNGYLGPLLSRVTRAVLHRPLRVLLAAVLLTACAAWFATGLEIRSSFEELLPSDVPSVAHVKELVRRVGGDGTVLVNVESTTGPDNIENAKAVAQELAVDYLAMGSSTVRSVEWNTREAESWYGDHWPLFVSVADLTKARDAVRAEVTKAKRRANPLLRLAADEAQSARPFVWTASTSTAIAPWLDPKALLPRDKIKERFSRYEDRLSPSSRPTLGDSRGSAHRNFAGRAGRTSAARSNARDRGRPRDRAFGQAPPRGIWRNLSSVCRGVRGHSSRRRFDRHTLSEYRPAIARRVLS